MIAEAGAALEATTLAAMLRGSTWAYPLVNAAHIIGVALLFGALVPLDLKLLGLWRNVPEPAATALLLPVAATGAGLATAAGGLLFVVKAADYLASPLFVAKIALVAAGAANAAVFAWRPGWRRPSAALSLVLWTAVIVLGRLIGYF